MGYMFYLARDDNRTLFELGKVIGDSMAEVLDLQRWDLSDYLDERPSPKMLPDKTEIVRRLTAELNGPYWRMGDKSSLYAQVFAQKLLDWTDGHPVIFTTQDDHDRVDEYEVTGDRYVDV